MPSFLDQTIGAIFVGVILAAILWGAGALQAFNYFSSNQEDNIWVKSAVALAFITDTIHQALITEILYQYVITHFGDIIFLLKIQKSLPVQIVLQQLTGTIVQSFFAFRIYRLSERNVYMFAPIIVFITAQLVGGIVYAVETSRIATFLELASLDKPAYAYAAFVMAADLSIAGMLTFMLQRARGKSSDRSRDPFKATVDGAVQKLIVMTMTNGLLSSFCAIGVFFSYVALGTGSQTFAYVPFFFIAGRLYFNSLMASLNMRTFVRSKLTPRIPTGASTTVAPEPWHGHEMHDTGHLAKSAQPAHVDLATHTRRRGPFADQEAGSEHADVEKSADIEWADETTHASEDINVDSTRAEPPSTRSPTRVAHVQTHSRKSSTITTRSWVGPRPRYPNQSPTTPPPVPQATSLGSVQDNELTAGHHPALATFMPDDYSTALPAPSHLHDFPSGSPTQPAVRALPDPSFSERGGRISEDTYHTSPFESIRPLPRVPGKK